MFSELFALSNFNAPIDRSLFTFQLQSGTFEPMKHYIWM